MSMIVSLADYGVGNLHSIRKALEMCDAEVRVVDDMSLLSDSDCIVFPGVGAFNRTMERLIPYKEAIVESLKAGTPCLGICIGMQILFKGSDEGNSPGLGYMSGKVVPLQARSVPHMGWNEVSGDDPLLEGTEDRFFYFAHSFHAQPEDDDLVVADTDYDIVFPSMFRKGNTYGTQFHPEKSSKSGLAVIRNFVAFAEGCQ